MLWITGHYRIKLTRFVFLDYIFILAKRECYLLSNLILREERRREITIE